MRKIILFIASSLDGYIARENGGIDWLPDDTASGYDDFIKSVDTVIMGKKTYEQILTFGDYPYGNKKSYVFTRDDKCHKVQNVEFAHDADKLVNAIRSESGTDIWLVGGAETVSIFANLGLVDEIRLSVIPVILGKGIPLFKNIKKEMNLQLIKTTEYDVLVEMHYKVKKSVD